MGDYKYIDYNKVLESVGGDTSFVAELMDIYLIETQKELAKFSERIERKSWVEVAETAHKMKGQASVVGAIQVHQMFAFIEDAIKSGKDVAEYESQLSEVVGLVSESISECEIIKAKLS